MNKEIEGIYSFPKGIPAFEDVDSFSIKKHDYFFIMSSNTVSFICVNYSSIVATDPLRYYPISDNDKHVYLNIVAVEDPVIDSTVNLIAPIALNIENRTGRQVILSELYSVKEGLPLDITIKLKDIKF